MEIFDNNKSVVEYQRYKNTAVSKTMAWKLIELFIHSTLSFLATKGLESFKLFNDKPRQSLSQRIVQQNIATDLIPRYVETSGICSTSPIASYVKLKVCLPLKPTINYFCRHIYFLQINSVKSTGFSFRHTVLKFTFCGRSNNPRQICYPRRNFNRRQRDQLQIIQQLESSYANC